MKRTALITGASAGIGAEFARQLAAKGLDLVLVARRTDRLEQLAQPLRVRHSVAVSCLEGDLSERDVPERIHGELAERGIVVDWLINNAGAAGPNLLEKPGFEQHRRYLELMMISVAHLCHLFVPAMRERSYGRIVNVASVAGRIIQPGDYSYGPTKAYLIALSEGMNSELKKQGVHVCALCPGFTHTEFHAVAGKEKLKQKTPGFIWYEADGVVRDGIAAVEKGRPIKVSGWLYRWLDPFFQSVLTRRLFLLEGLHNRIQAGKLRID